ncbi:MAG TPA: hypothetical protein VKA09_15965 [Nitrososphaeraceae archaeon]|nr:hypothetical protein [Nitrososphaeraceae archaeon]
MLVKVNNIDIDKNKVRVSKLDIDDYGSIITLKEVELKIPANDDSIAKRRKNLKSPSHYAENVIS